MLDLNEVIFLIASKKSVQKNLEHGMFLTSIIAICAYIYVYCSEVWLRVPCMLVIFVCCLFLFDELREMIIDLSSIRWLMLKSQANESALMSDIDEIEKFVNQEKDV